MPLTKDELLAPRYYLGKEYPNSYQAPCILHVAKDGELYSQEQGYVDYAYKVTEHEAKTKFPHLFRKLHWSEFRAIEDMPLYVRWDKENGNVYQVLSHEGCNSSGFPLFRYLTGYGHKCVSTFICRIPATREEYEAFVNRKKQK